MEAHGGVPQGIQALTMKFESGDLAARQVRSLTEGRWQCRSAS